MKENIFSNFYTKVLSFFSASKDDGETARDTASSRLKLVLMQDRSNLDGATMQKMREQLISVISKYIEIDTEALDLNLEGDGDEIALMLNIPVIRARTKEEIEEMEALEAAEKEKKEESQEDEESEESESDDVAEEDSEEDSEKDSQEEEETPESEEIDKNDENEEEEPISEEAKKLIEEKVVASEDNPFVEKEEKKKKKK